ncbi:MAG: hypothetical protein HPY44_19360 [Armatimonadetes bacterium]|nr:hypothetical protein [Armatimonadota bacterium]
MSEELPGRGDELRQYRLEEPAAEDPLGQLWRARHVVTGRTAWVRVFRPGVLRPDAAQRISRYMGVIGNPAIVRPVEAHLDVGWPHIIFDGAEGEPVSGYLAEGPVPWPNATEIAAQLLEGLADLHAHGQSYGVVLPEAVVVTADAVCLVDTGTQAVVTAEALARLPFADQVLGPDGVSSPAGDVAAVRHLLAWLIAGKPAASPDESVAAETPESILNLGQLPDSAEEAAEVLRRILAEEMAPPEEPEMPDEAGEPQQAGEAPADSAAPMADLENLTGTDISVLEVRVLELEGHLRAHPEDRALEETILRVKRHIGQTWLEAIAGLRGKAILTLPYHRGGGSWIAPAVGSALLFVGLWWVADTVLRGTQLDPGVRRIVSIAVPLAFLIAGGWVALALGVTRSQLRCYALVNENEIICHDAQSMRTIAQIAAREIRELATVGDLQSGSAAGLGVNITHWDGGVTRLRFLEGASFDSRGPAA